MPQARVVPFPSIISTAPQPSSLSQLSVKAMDALTTLAGDNPEAAASLLLLLESLARAASGH